MFPALTDFTFMEGEKGRMFVNSPNALAGNTAEKCDTSGAAWQAAETGLIDRIGTEEEILTGLRQMVSLLPSNNEDTDTYAECLDDLNRPAEGIEGLTGDSALAVSMIADDQLFFEIKPDYGKDIAAGFIRLNGATVGVVANRSELYDEEGNVAESLGTLISSRGARKAADFVTFCDSFDIPVLTLTNVTGFKADFCNEKMLAASVGKMIYAFANATVPKVNVIVGKAYGNAYVAMNSKGLGADLVYAWENAEIGMMDADLASKIMFADADASELREKAAEYRKLQSGVDSAAARGYVDTVIAPADTRKYVIGAFEMLYSKSEESPVRKHGTV